MVLDVADLGTLRDLADGKDVPDEQRRGRPALNCLAGMKALGRDDEGLLEPGAVRLLEDELRQRGAPPRVMQKLLHDAGDLSRALGGVDGPEFGGALAVVRVRPEYIPVALSLNPNDVPHVGRPTKTAQTVRALVGFQSPFGPCARTRHKPVGVGK
jgi:hypothetical protein